MLTRQENQLRSTSGKVYFFLSKKLLAVHQPRDLESLDQAHLNIPQFTWRAFCGRKSQRSLTLFPPATGGMWLQCGTEHLPLLRGSSRVVFD